MEYNRFRTFQLPLHKPGGHPSTNIYCIARNKDKKQM